MNYTYITKDIQEKKDTGSSSKKRNHNKTDDMSTHPRSAHIVDQMSSKHFWPQNNSRLFILQSCILAVGVVEIVCIDETLYLCIACVNVHNLPFTGRRPANE